MEIENALRAKKLSGTGEEGTASDIDFQRHPLGTATSLEVKYPESVADMLAPNELSSQVRFFNNVFREVFRTAFIVLPNLKQFREYVVGQQIHRWELQEKFEEFSSKLKMI